ncbi:Sec1-like protein [Artemisia annua]|uniref:Sec1-like protein n=1 Tax=Artemisia annua TaxID=35608 RepID=A0A2U1MFI0_ARTAN|nr:Sec1-like protein [Artemisia annua]
MTGKDSSDDENDRKKEVDEMSRAAEKYAKTMLLIISVGEGFELDLRRKKNTKKLLTIIEIITGDENYPKATTHEIELVIEKILCRMLCGLSTLDVVPIIKCPRDGPAEKVASLLDQRLCDHLQLDNKDILFSVSGKRYKGEGNKKTQKS